MRYVNKPCVDEHALCVSFDDSGGQGGRSVLPSLLVVSLSGVVGLLLTSEEYQR
jgi:hypothetical protein